MKVAPSFRATTFPSAPRTRVERRLKVSLKIARARLTEAADEAQRLGRPDAMRALGFIRDALDEVDRALDRLT
jgi:hypothetical protein